LTVYPEPPECFPRTLVYSRPMRWEHKGIVFTITTQPMGPLVMISAKTPREGMFVRVRPFSAIGRTEEEALELLRSQIRLEFRKVPETTPS
jgi:hypothetical protein